MKSLEQYLNEMMKHGSPYQRVVIWVDGFDYYYDTTVDGARVAVAEDMSKLMVERTNDDAAEARWLPVMIYCKSSD